jgi:streptogramin lyase
MSTLTRLLILVSLALVALAGPAHAAIPIGKITEFSDGLSPSGSVPVGVAAGPDGNVWFTDTSGPFGVGKMTPGGEATEFHDGLSAFRTLGFIAAGTDGNLWFGAGGAKPAIGRVTTDGTIATFADGLQDHAVIGHLTAGPDGNMWFVDSRRDHEMVGRVTPQGQITEFTVPDTTDGGLGDITLGSDGNLWFTVQGRDHAVAQVTPSGVVSLFHSPLFGQNSGSYPLSITAGPGGDLWFIYSGRSQAFVNVARMTTGGTATAVPVLGALQASSNSGLDHITEGPDGHLWMTDNGWLGQSIIRMSTTGHATAFVTGLQLLSQDLPRQIVTGPDGNMWFADAGVTRGIGRVGTASGPLPPQPTPIITCTSGSSYCANSLVARVAHRSGLKVTARLLNHGRVYALGTGTQFGVTLRLTLTHITGYLEGQFTLEEHARGRTHNAHIILHRLDR